MRPAFLALATAGLVAVLVIGLLQAGGDDPASGAATKALTRAEVSRPVAGAPADLAALRRQINVIRPGGLKAFDTQLRALRGHPVVVNLWASWCTPCRAELPFFQRQANERAATTAFLGINVADNRGDAADMAREFPMPYPSFEDARSASLGRFKLRGLPVTIFFDAEGERVQVLQGGISTEAKLAAAIDRYAGA